MYIGSKESAIAKLDLM